jgi:hypothetical protein
LSVKDAIFYPEDGAGSSEILAPVDQIAWYYVPEECNLSLDFIYCIC